jgi:mRNA degradation ribonuclease J1/J2
MDRITETFEAAVNSGRCVSVDAENMEHLFGNFEIDAAVTLKEFRKSKWTDRDESKLLF